MFSMFLFKLNTNEFFIEYNLGYWIIKTDSGNISVKDLSGVRNMNKWKSDLFIQLIPNKEVWSLPNYYNSPSIELKKSMFPKSNNSINKSYSDNLDGSKKNILVPQRRPKKHKKYLSIFINFTV